MFYFILFFCVSQHMTNISWIQLERFVFQGRESNTLIKDAFMRFLKKCW